MPNDTSPTLQNAINQLLDSEEIKVRDLKWLKSLASTSDCRNTWTLDDVNRLKGLYYQIIKEPTRKVK